MELEAGGACRAARPPSAGRAAYPARTSGEYGRARLHGARASCRGALSHPTECSNASGRLTAPRLEVLVSRPLAGAGASIRQLKIGLGSARYCSAEEHTTPCTHGTPYGHVLAAPGGARRPPQPNTTIGDLPPRAVCWLWGEIYTPLSRLRPSLHARLRTHIRRRNLQGLFHLKIWVLG